MKIFTPNPTKNALKRLEKYRDEHPPIILKNRELTELQRNIANHLWIIRHHSGLSQNQLSRKTNGRLSDKQISMFETGYRFPTKKHIKIIYDALDLKVEEFPL